MLELILFGIKGYAAVALIFLFGGGALGYLYGSKIEAKAQALASKAQVEVKKL